MLYNYVIQTPYNSISDRKPFTMSPIRAGLTLSFSRLKWVGPSRLAQPDPIRTEQSLVKTANQIGPNRNLNIWSGLRSKWSGLVFFFLKKLQFSV